MSDEWTVMGEAGAAWTTGIEQAWRWHLLVVERSRWVPLRFTRDGADGRTEYMYPVSLLSDFRKWLAAQQKPRDTPPAQLTLPQVR